MGFLLNEKKTHFISNANRQTVTGVTVNEKISGLKAGLYLIIPHGSNEAYGTGKEYVSTRTDDADVKKQVTLANSAKFTYTFSSELVSLPNKGPDENGVINTANAGPWQYDADVDLTLKFGKEERYGQLEIIKNLKNFEDHNEATVKEIYSGKVYNVDTDKTGGPITAEQITQVEFTNEYEEHHNGGGSVTNHFIYDGRQNKWGWYQMTDSSTEGEVIQSSEKNE